MTDHKNLNALILGLKGWEPAFISIGGYDLDVLIHPNADTDGTFEAYDLAEGELLTVNGWLADQITFDTNTEVFA